MLLIVSFNINIICDFKFFLFDEKETLTILVNISFQHCLDSLNVVIVSLSSLINNTTLMYIQLSNVLNPSSSPISIDPFSTSYPAFSSSQLEEKITRINPNLLLESQANPQNFPSM